VRLSVLRMISRSRLLPMDPPRVLPKLPNGGPAGTWVSTQRPLRTANFRTSPSEKDRFSSHPLDFAWNFPHRPISRKIVRLSVLRMSS
jgi:hypothetical protein